MNKPEAGANIRSTSIFSKPTHLSHKAQPLSLPMAIKPQRAPQPGLKRSMSTTFWTTVRSAGSWAELGRTEVLGQQAKALAGLGEKALCPRVLTESRQGFGPHFTTVMALNVFLGKKEGAYLTIDWKLCSMN